jgi:prefoldin subunit 5
VADARDVELDIVANDKTDRATRSAAKGFEDLDRKAKRSNHSISDFEKRLKSSASSADKFGSELSNTFSSVLGSAFKTLPTEAKAAVGASVAAAALASIPVIVTAIDAAVLAGLGAGGLAVGIALAAKDPRVGAAYSNLGRDISTRLQQSSAPFVDHLVDGAGKFGRTFTKIAPAIDRSFANLATTIDPFVEGLSKAAENLMPGLEHAFAASVPLLKDLAREAPRFGKVIGELFDAIANAGPGAELFFKFILVSVEALIKSFQMLVDTIAPVANLLAAVGNSLGLWDIGKVDAFATRIDKTGASARTTGGSFDALSRSTYNTAAAADQANAAYSRLFGEMMSVDQANLAVKVGMTQLTETLKGHKKTLNEDTVAGQQNVGAILSQIGVLEQKRQADIAAGNGTKEATAKANAAYASQVGALRSLLGQLGFNKKEIDNLIAKYQQLAAVPDVNVNVTTHYREDGRPLAGNSRYGPLDNALGGSWRPARFAASAFADAPGGGGRTMPPTRVTSTLNATFNLDGRPFRDMTVKVAQDEGDRRAWRDRVTSR